jgi:hypothetical protein
MSTLHADPKLHGHTWTEARECTMRELKYRRHVYPRRVAELKMTQSLADREIGTMAAITEYFAELAERERLL